MVLLEGVKVSSACAGIFRCSRCEYIGSFSSFLKVQKSFICLGYGSHLTIELTWRKDFRCI